MDYRLIRSVWVSLALVMAIPSAAQTRAYLSASAMGASLLEWYYDENYERIGYVNKFPTLGLELGLQSRIAGSAYFYTGVNYYSIQSEYVGEQDQSTFSQHFIGIPVMLRLEVKRAFAYDIGLVPNYLIKANLYELDFPFSSSGPAPPPVEASGDVSPYLPRFGLLFRQKFTFYINRIHLGFEVSNVLTNTGTGTLADNWKLGYDSSLYAWDNKLFVMTYGIFAGIRIK
jgi:hypothetical protein